MDKLFSTQGEMRCFVRPCIISNLTNEAHMAQLNDIVDAHEGIKCQSIGFVRYYSPM